MTTISNLVRKNHLKTIKGFILLSTLLLFCRAATPALAAENSAASVTGPWTEKDLIQPQALAHALADTSGKKPKLVYVGFPLLYKAGRIPGALYFGPGRNPEGLASLKQWARSLRPDEPVVMYCGCCPWGECPNIRPAFKALRDAGLKRLKLLYLPKSFLHDWVEKGYPAEKGE